MEFSLPLGVNEQTTKNYQQALQIIEKRTDLRPFILEKTRLMPRGGMRIEFIIQKDGKAVKYSATHEHVLRVDQEPSTMQIQEWKQRKLSRITLEQQLRDAIQQDPSLQDEQK